MQGKNHVALGLAVPLAGAMLTGSPLPPTAAAWAGLIVGSLAPDMDGEGSIAYWGAWLPRHVTPRPVILLLNKLGRATSGAIRAAVGHRKALHWPVIGAALAYAGLTLQVEWLLWFGVGYVLHIAGDALTKAGVPLLGPVSTTDISFSPMRTGGFVEKIFGLLLWTFIAWRLLEALPPQPAWLQQMIDRFSAGL